MRSNPRAGFVSLASAVLVLACVGCVRESQTGDATAFSFDPSLANTTYLVSGLLALGAWQLPSRVIGLRVAMGFFATLGLLVVGPMMQNDRVVVDATGFSLRTGFWFYPTYREVKFDELSAARVRRVESYDHRGRPKLELFLDAATTRGTIEFPLGTLMTWRAPSGVAPIERILQELEERGIATGGASIRSEIKG